MDTESSELLFIVIPAVLGLVVVAYMCYRAATAWSDLRRATRGWIVLAMTAAIAMYWVGELLAWADTPSLSEWKPVSDLGFVVFGAWLAVCMSALGTKYAKLGHADEFKAWIKGHPVNAVSAWGLAGIAAVVLAIIVDNYGPEENGTLWLVLPATAYLIASSAIVLAYHFRRAKVTATALTPQRGKFRMALLAACWMLIPTIVVSLGVAAQLESSLGLYNPYNWMLVLLLSILAGAVSMAGMRTVSTDAYVDFVRREGFREYDIPRGAYLIHDQKSDSAFALFSDLTTLPLRPDAHIPGSEAGATDTLVYLIPQGLIVTREFPDKVRQKHNLHVTPIIWLTETPGERRIAPTSLSMLTDTIVKFMESNPNSIVLLEGIEYICTYNDFRKVLRFLDNLNEAAWITKARLIVTVDPKAFDIKDLALLERDRNVVRGSAGVEDLKVESRVPVASA